MRQALQGRTLFGLVNNAGIANHACLAHQLIEEFRRVIQINLIGTLAVMQVRMEALFDSNVTCCTITEMNTCDIVLCCCVRFHQPLHAMFIHTARFIPAVMQFAAATEEAPSHHMLCTC